MNILDDVLDFRIILMRILEKCENPGPEDRALIHPRWVWFIKPAPKEVMPGLGRSFKAKPLNSDPRNAGVFSIK